MNKLHHIINYKNKQKQLKTNKNHQKIYFNFEHMLLNSRS